jgi:hypothetical protein
MSTVMAPEVLADPLGVVVDLVAGVESALDRVVIAEVVEGVAGGRAKRRRLAHALRSDPSLLVAGRSPAPRVVGDLLIALRKVGGSCLSLPVCASAANRCAALNAEARTGTAEFVARGASPALAAARSGGCRAVIARGGHAATGAHPRRTTIPRRSWWAW